MTVTLTEPGVYDLPAAVYHSDPVQGGSLSSSGAKKLLPPSCPALFKHYLDHGQTPRVEFDLGHAAHAAVLGAGEPIQVIDADDYRSKDARAQRDAAYADGRIPLLRADHEVVQGMAAAIRDHPVAGRLFAPDAGTPEQTLIWRDGEFGVWRRAMLDWLPNRQRGQRLIVADYKTSRSAEPSSITKALDSYGYAQQAAWYLDAVKALNLHGGIEPAFVFVFQEKTAPYLVTVAQPDPDALNWGDVLNRKAIHTYRTCMRTGHWPGYADDVISVGLPPWAVRQHEDALARGDYETEENAA